MVWTTHLSWLPVAMTLTTATAAPTASRPLQPRSLGGGVPLRIMPLGASITAGDQSSDGNGYRAGLRANVTAGGNLVNMVGNRSSGSMKDNQNEGWSGFIIGQVLDKAKTSVPVWKPNVVTLNAGTNDASGNVNVTGAGDRLRTLIEYVWEASPGSTVLLSTLLVNANENTEKNVEGINPQYKALADELIAEGKKLVFVDMHGQDGPQLGDLKDGTHPNDFGYGKMALLWYKGLQEASDQGFLSQAEDIGIPDDGDDAQGRQGIQERC